MLQFIWKYFSALFGLNKSRSTDSNVLEMEPLMFDIETPPQEEYNDTSQSFLLSLSNIFSKSESTKQIDFSQKPESNVNWKSLKSIDTFIYFRNVHHSHITRISKLVDVCCCLNQVIEDAIQSVPSLFNKNMKVSYAIVQCADEIQIESANQDRSRSYKLHSSSVYLHHIKEDFTLPFYEFLNQYATLLDFQPLLKKQKLVLTCFISKDVDYYFI